MSNTLGYLVLWSIPDVTAPYADLQALAASSGFSPDFIPTPPDPRHAWEKATNLGAGLKVDAPPVMAAQIRAQYGVDPMVRLTSKVISNSAPKLVRHIVREVTIFAQDEQDPEKRAQKQLNIATAAIISYDTEKKMITSITDSTTGEKVFDREGWVNGNVQSVVDDLMQKADQAMHKADGQSVRNGIREFMDSLHATLLTNGGGYFVPASIAGVEQKLDSFQQYVKGLVQWKANNNRLTCNVYAVTDTGDVFSTRNVSDISRSAIDEFRVKIQSLVEKVGPLLGGTAKGKTADKVRGQAYGEYTALKDGVMAYGESLGDGFVNDLATEALTELLTIKADFTKYQEAVSDDLGFISDMLKIAQNKVMEAQ
jgi:hypothetical protein